MNACFFKIIISNYNNKLYIKKCINSILNQKFKDFKIIIVDDLSTDGSYDICKEFQKRYPDKIIVKQVDTKGYAGKCRNIGLHLDIGSKYTWIIDGDDQLHNDNTLLNIHNCIIKNNFPDLVRCSYDEVRNGKVKLVRLNTNIQHIMKNGAAPWKNCFKSKFDEIKFVEDRAKCNDIVHFLRLFDEIDITKIAVVPYPCCMYNISSVTSCQHNKNVAYSPASKKAEALLINDLLNESFDHNFCVDKQKQIINTKKKTIPN